MRSTHVPDTVLIERFRHSGDKEALGQLFLRYMELVYGVCLKYLGDPESAKGAVMDIYEHLNRKLPAHEVENFSAWLYMVSKNHCLQQLRKKSNLLTVSLDDPDMQKGRELHQEDDGFDLDLTADVADQLHDCLDGLPERQQVCIRMLYFEKKSYAEISQLTSQPLDLVRSQIQNGRRNLKKCIENSQRRGAGTDL